MQIVVSAIPVFIFNQVEQIKEVTGGGAQAYGLPAETCDSNESLAPVTLRPPCKLMPFLAARTSAILP